MYSKVSLALITLAALAIAACGATRDRGQAPPSTSSAASPNTTASPTAATDTSPSTSASTSGSPSPSPSVPAFRAATASELSAMISAGKGPAEQYLGLGDWSSCSLHQSCLNLSQANGQIGINAGVLYGSEGCPAGCGGAGCWIFLYQDATGWHFVNARCAQAPGYVPGTQDQVYVSGCANVRTAPGFSSAVIACLPNRTVVNVDSAPVYTDSKIWWHLEGQGWMAHDFLVAPLSVP